MIHYGLNPQEYGEHWRERAEKAEAEIERLQDEEQRLRQDINELIEEKVELNRKVEYLREALESIASMGPVALEMDAQDEALAALARARGEEGS